MKTRHDLARKAVDDADTLARTVGKRSSRLKRLYYFMVFSIIICSSLVTIFGVFNRDPTYIALGMIITILKALSSSFKIQERYIGLKKANIEISRASRSLSQVLVNSPTDEQINMGVLELYEKLTKTELKLIEQEGNLGVHESPELAEKQTEAVAV